jgi:transcriptional regulator with XRE-family HTH domain
VTASQARAARTLLGWNLKDLAQKADLQMSAIEGIEEGIHDASTLCAIQAAFEKAGIIFVGTTGVRLKHDKAKGVG